MRITTRIVLIIPAIACFILAGPVRAEVSPDRPVAAVDPIEAIIPGDRK
jgi:hypothetical protein